jgi:hypothetical protein
MQQTRIAEVEFWPLDQTLADVQVPRVQQANHEGPFEDVEIASHRHVRDTEGARQLGVVELLAILMAQHGPKPAQSGSGDVDAELGDIPLDEGGYILLTSRKESSSLPAV